MMNRYPSCVDDRSVQAEDRPDVDACIVGEVEGPPRSKCCMLKFACQSGRHVVGRQHAYLRIEIDCILEPACDRIEPAKAVKGGQLGVLTWASRHSRLT